MKHDYPPPQTQALLETAGEWLARREDSSWSFEDEASFQAWLSSDPAHDIAYKRVSRTWFAAAQLTMAPSLTAAPMVSRPVMPGRRWWQHLFHPGGKRALAGGGVMVGMLITGAGYWYGNHPVYSHSTEAVSTQASRIDLPDGSTVTINRGTQLAVTYYPWRREVQLYRGEAFFEVAPTGRSFTVAAGKSQVRVVGTAFNVDLSEQVLAVAVAQGKVEVKPDRDNDHVLMLVANDGVTLDRMTDAVVPVIYPSQTVGSWRQGRLVFRNAMLGDVATQLSRYRTQPVEIVDRVLAHRKVSGVASTTDPDSFIDSIARLLNARVTHLPDGRVQLDQR